MSGHRLSPRKTRKPVSGAPVMDGAAKLACGPERTIHGITRSEVMVRQTGTMAMQGGS